MTPPRQISRRDVLRAGLIGGGAVAFLPGALRGAAGPLTVGEPAGDARILVLLHLVGGNDGLNAIVPYRNDHYYRARPKLAIPAGDVLPLDDSHGLHPSLAGLREPFDRGNVAILHSVGYPNPNRSHFRSMEIWHAGHLRAGDPVGWIGRHFARLPAGTPEGVGVALEEAAPRARAGPTVRGVCFADPETVVFPDEAVLGLAGRSPGDLRLPDPAGRRLNDTRVPTSGRTAALDQLDRIETAARRSIRMVRSVLEATPTRATYPATELGRDLSVVARLVAGGAPTQVYFVSQDGFDTHAAQLGAHGKKLGKAGDAISAFVEDLRTLDCLDRVAVLVYSEFGRRVAENGSGGTDHGAGGPCLLVGGRVRPGFHGEAASLAPADLIGGDLRPGIDFRSVYATLLSDWLRWPSEPVLGEGFPPLDLFTRG